MAVPPRVFWILMAFGLVLRIAAIELRPISSLMNAPDEREYYLLAYNLAHGEGFALEGTPTAYRSVAFPALASVVMIIAGPSVYPILYLQALLSCFTALVLFQIVAWRFGERAAVFSGAVWLFYPGAILSTALFATATLLSALWVAALALFDRLQAQNFFWWDALLLGLMVGLLSLTRNVGLVLLVSLLIYLIFIRLEPWRRTEWRAALVVLAAASIVVVPWMLRNQQMVGSFTVNTNSGRNLMFERSPTLSRDLHLPEEPVRRDTARAIQSAQMNISAQEEDSLFARVRHLTPREVLQHKLARLWGTDISLWARYAIEEQPETVIQRLRHTPLLPLAAASLPTLLLAGIGISGLTLVRNFPGRGLYLLQFGLCLLGVLLTYGLPRDYFPFLPMLIVAGAALWRMPAWYTIRLKRRLLALALLGALCLLWIYGVMTIAQW